MFTVTQLYKSNWAILVFRQTNNEESGGNKVAKTERGTYENTDAERFLERGGLTLLECRAIS